VRISDPEGRKTENHQPNTLADVSVADTLFALTVFGNVLLGIIVLAECGAVRRWADIFARKGGHVLM